MDERVCAGRSKVELMDDTAVLGQAVLSARPGLDGVPFQITSSGSTQSGALRISLLGAGSVTIDQVSLMGQDSIATGGYRPDLLEAVEGLRPPIIRWRGLFCLRVFLEGRHRAPVPAPQISYYPVG